MPGMPSCTARFSAAHSHSAPALGAKLSRVRLATLMQECAMPINAMLQVALIGAMLAPLQNTSSPDTEGFIRDWLVLAPIAIEGESGADQIDKDFIAGEAAVKPKAGDKVRAGATELTWTPYKSADYYIDFLCAL